MGMEINPCFIHKSQKIISEMFFPSDSKRLDQSNVTTCPSTQLVRSQRTVSVLTNTVIFKE